MPPISSELASQLNPEKVIDFLESCLMKGYKQFKQN
jgi:hypothetical protein